MSTENQVVDKGDLVVIYDDLAGDVIHDMLGYSGVSPTRVEAFKEAFEVVPPKRGHWMADPDEDFYQGINVMAVIRRKADGKLFGFEYWTPIAKHAEVHIEANGDEHGLEFDVPDGFDWDNDYYPSAYVFQPVEPFTITGYKITEGAAA